MTVEAQKNRDESPHLYLENLIRNQDFRVARIVALKLIEEDPKSIYAYRKLIAIEESLGRTQQVMLIYEKLMSISDDIYDILRWYQKLYQVRDYSALLSHFDSLWPQLSSKVSYPAPEAEVWIICLKAALKMGELKLYQIYASKLPILEGKTSRYYHIVAAYHLARHSPGLASDVLKKGVNRFPSCLSLKLHLGLSTFAEGDQDVAQRYLLEALKQGSSVALTYLLELCPNKSEINQLLRAIFAKEEKSSSPAV